jgi:hypothetical protein
MFLIWRFAYTWQGCSPFTKICCDSKLCILHFSTSFVWTGWLTQQMDIEAAFQQPLSNSSTDVVVSYDHHLKFYEITLVAMLSWQQLVMVPYFPVTHRPPPMLLYCTQYAPGAPGAEAAISTLTSTGPHTRSPSTTPKSQARSTGGAASDRRSDKNKSAGNLIVVGRKPGTSLGVRMDPESTQGLTLEYSHRLSRKHT